MTILVYVKKIGKKLQALKPCAFEIPGKPDSLKELIRSLVEYNVSVYNHRLNHHDPSSLPSAQETEDMAQAGKIGFGILYGIRESDPAEAVETALEGFSDGLFRFFLNGSEITELNAPLDLKDNDEITIIRLTMLTGGFF